MLFRSCQVIRGQIAQDLNPRPAGSDIGVDFDDLENRAERHAAHDEHVEQRVQLEAVVVDELDELGL